MSVFAFDHNMPGHTVLVLEQMKPKVQRRSIVRSFIMPSCTLDQHHPQAAHTVPIISTRDPVVVFEFQWHLTVPEGISRPPMPQFVPSEVPMTVVRGPLEGTLPYT